MIINIPLQIDEAKMEEVVQKDYEGRVIDEITRYIKAVLTKNAPYAYYYKGAEEKVSGGMEALIENKIDEFLKSHKEEIIEHASKLLAEKLARSKKGKEILDIVFADAERREEE